MKIVYMLTDECNSNCFHCYKKRWGRRRELCDSLKDIENLLQEGHEIIVAGAEVLLNPELLEIYKMVGQKYVLSNGILLAVDIKNFDSLIVNGINKIRISWHIGFQEKLNSILEWIIKKAIKNAQKIGFSVQINCIINNGNYLHIQEIINSVLKNNIRELRFLQFLPIRKDLIKFQLTQEQKYEFLRSVEKVRGEYAKNKLCISLHANFSPTLSKKSLAAQQHGLFCPAGKSFAVIETDNKIYPCPFLNEERYCIGLFQKGRVLINREISNPGKVCLAEKTYCKNH